jgi:hypothetical protein
MAMQPQASLPLAAAAPGWTLAQVALPPAEGPVRMTAYGQAVLLVLITVLIVGILRLMAQRRLTMGMGLFWLAAMAGLSALVGSHTLLVFIAGMLGTLYPDAAIRLLAFVALLFVQIYFSVRISVQEQRLGDLGQAVALLEEELRSERKKHAAPEAGVAREQAGSGESAAPP